MNGPRVLIGTPGLDGKRQRRGTFLGLIDDAAGSDGENLGLMAVVRMDGRGLYLTLVHPACITFDAFEAPVQGADGRFYASPCAESEERTNDQITERLYEVYTNLGQQGVYDYARTRHPEWPWSRCEPCEDVTPTHDGACAVCGTAREEAK